MNAHRAAQTLIAERRLEPKVSVPVEALDPATGLPYSCIRELLGQAVPALVAIFDDACARTNGMRARTGQLRRIAAHSSGIERRYCTGDPASDPRFVALFISVPARDGHIFGGAFVNTTHTPPSIYLVPRILRGAVHWTVQATGTPFDAETARDLFASTFGDDGEATGRLMRLVGYDLFQMPWS